MYDKLLRGKVALLFFLATETLFFAGLISAYWVLRGQIVPWPPSGQPRLPAVITGINTLIFLASAPALYGAERAARRGCHLCLLGWLGLTLLSGALFLGGQGYEWVRLLGFGLTTTHNIYGGIFYMVVGAHALHVLAALCVLLVVIVHATLNRYTPSDHGGLTLCRIYWTFVVLLWPILYALVYF